MVYILTDHDLPLYHKPEYQSINKHKFIISTINIIGFQYTIDTLKSLVDK